MEGNINAKCVIIATTRFQSALNELYINDELRFSLFIVSLSIFFI